MQIWPRALILFLSLFSVAMHATAENPFDFASTPGKLPKEVAPTEYSIRIVPNVEARTFSGTAIIKVNSTKPVRQLVMNALEVDVSGAMVDDEALPASAIKVDRKQELLTLSYAVFCLKKKHTIAHT